MQRWNGRCVSRMLIEKSLRTLSPSEEIPDAERFLNFHLLGFVRNKVCTWSIPIAVRVVFTCFPFMMPIFSAYLCSIAPRDAIINTYFIRISPAIPVVTATTISSAITGDCLCYHCSQDDNHDGRNQTKIILEHCSCYLNIKRNYLFYAHYISRWEDYLRHFFENVFFKFDITLFSTVLHGTLIWTF